MSATPTTIHDPSIFAPALHGLIGDAQRRHIRPGTALYHEGDEPAEAFALHRGLVKLVKTSPGGAQSLVAFRSAGGLIGEHPAIDGLPRLTSAVAVTDCTVSELSTAQLIEAVRTDGEVALALLTQFAGHLRAATQQVLAVSTGDASSLVAARLVELATSPMFEPLRTTRRHVTSIAMPISQHELATWAGVSQRSVAAALQRLREAGTIETGRLSVDVHDLGALRALANGRSA